MSKQEMIITSSLSGADINALQYAVDKAVETYKAFDDALDKGEAGKNSRDTKPCDVVE